MLVFRPPKIAWPISIILSLIIIIVINSLNYFGNSQIGILENVRGTLSIQKIGKRQILMFYGGGRSGVCNFDSCMKSEVTAFDGKKVSVKMDQENKIYEITVADTVIFSAVSTGKTGGEYPLGVILPLLGLIICVVYIIFNWKKYGE